MPPTMNAAGGFMEDGMAIHLPLDDVGPQAVLNGRPAKP